MKEKIRQIYQRCRTFRGAERKLEKWIIIGGILEQSSATMTQKHWGVSVITLKVIQPTD